MSPPSTSNTSKHAIGKAEAADPKYGQSFDPWNSSATGHQRADNHLGRSTGWRQSRNLKLTSQFKGGPGGGQRVSDTVGAGSKDWDPKLKALVTPELWARAKVSVADMLVKPGTMGRSISPFTSMMENTSQREEFGNPGDLTTEEKLTAQREDEDETRQAGKMQSRGAIFDGVVVYINGSTHPLISDHKLKYVLAEHGAKTSINLGRRQVTHVILGRSAGGSGAGGGLAGGKLQKEIQKVGGRGVKFVGAEWVIESIKAGKRLPEAKFSNLKIASKGQQSVYGLYSKPNATTEPSTTQ